MTLKQRINSGFILAMAFLLVFASNWMNRSNFSKIERNVNSVFDNRVVAQEYIYGLNNLFHAKEMGLTQDELIAPSPEIDGIISKFAATELTREESVHLIKLQENYSKLQTVEEFVDNNHQTIPPQRQKEMAGLLEDINGNLDALAAVQLSESKQITALSNKSLGISQMLYRLEIAFLIVIGILFLIIVFYKTPSPDHGLQ